MNGLEVSGGFFSTLGVTPWQGRLIEAQDDSSCQLTKVVASYGFWKSQMGGVPITANTTIVAEGKIGAGAGRDAAVIFRHGGGKAI